MTRFVHLTDLHLSHADLNDPHLSSDTTTTLKQVLGRICALDPVPDFVVLSGDLTNHGDVESYQLLRGLVETLPMPVIPALGNHDRRAEFRSVFGGYGDGDAPLFHDSVHDGVHVIALDSSVPNRVGGGIEPEQFDRLETTLRAHPQAPKLLICHHPPHRRSTPLAWESLTEADTRRLAQALKGHDVVGILSGHVHMNRVLQWQGVPIIINMGLHATVDVLSPLDMVIEEGSGFADCRVDTDGLQVTFVPHAPSRRVLGRIAAETLGTFR